MSVPWTCGWTSTASAGQPEALRRRSSTPYALVHYVSQFLVLEPGDLINTGTPPGVGMGMKPPVWLQLGDVMELGVTRLGSQRQRVLAPRCQRHRHRSGQPRNWRTPSRRSPHRSPLDDRHGPAGRRRHDEPAPLGLCRHQQVNPPSTIRSTPVQKLAASLSRKMAGPTSSSTVAIRRSGVSDSNWRTCSATSGRAFIGVAV